MRQAIGSGVPREDLFAQPGPALRAEVGDTLIVGSEGAAGIPRIGEIVAVVGPHGLPPYRVRWLAGEYESLIEPGRSARVQKGHLARQTRDAPGASRGGSRIPPPRRGIREGHRGRVPRPPAARTAPGLLNAPIATAHRPWSALLRWVLIRLPFFEVLPRGRFSARPAYA